MRNRFSVTVFAFFLLFTPVILYAQWEFPAINTEDVYIVRDEWGIPHIYGKTDADAAYGLAWAHAEDDFASMQDMMLMASANMGRYMGKEGAKIDYLVHAMRIDELIEEKYYTDLSEDMRRYLEGFAQGINAFAKANPREVKLRRSFPIEPQDIIRGYCLSLGFFSGLHSALQGIFDGSILTGDVDIDYGSNAFAIQGKRMQDGKTTLIINAHQPIEGPVAFYEAHVVSEEGMNMYGGLFPGSVTIKHGVNENLGWAHTVNGIDRIDIYQLEMHPENENKYLFDGEWLELEQRRVPLRVRVWSGIRIPVRQTAYWSVYGPTFKSDHGVFSVRTAVNMNIKAVEQWYRMVRSYDLESFKEALDVQGLPMMNIIYADKEDNIFYINYGLIPQRHPDYEWKKVLPGNTSETLWTEFHPVENLIQYLNPECGFLYNVNNSPLFASCEGNNANIEDYDITMGFRVVQNNRGRRVQEFLEIWENQQLTLEELFKMKFDQEFPSESPFLAFIEDLKKLDDDEYPEFSDVLCVLRDWDYSMNPESEGASIFMLITHFVMENLGGSTAMFFTELRFDNNIYVETLSFVRDHMRRHYNTFTVPLGKIFRHRRGNKDFAIGGFPDVMASMYGKVENDGTFTAFVGEGLIIIARFNDDGVDIKSINAYGASSRPDSPHYNDQMELFVNNKFRKAYLEKEEVMKRACKVYHPGER